MNRHFARSFWCLVLCHFIVSICFAQRSDSIIVFPDRKNPAETERSKSQLGAIVSGGIGTFNGFTGDDKYGSVIQPTIGFDFLAEPGGAIHLLLGGRFGISKPITSEVTFGFRQPFGIGDPRSLMVFTDLGLLFFSDDTKESAVNTGIRLAFGARTFGSVDLEYRLAGEFRGSSKRESDNNLNRTLWWAGAEVGIAFSLVNDSKILTHKDSLRASLHFIASEDELEEFDNLTSTSRLDEWVDRFWRRRDVTPDSPDSRANEARMEFERRVKIANETFSRPKKLGVLTDPGRVLAIYGQPDDIESAGNISNDRSLYKMWIYHHRIVGQPIAVFLFLDDPPKEWKQLYSNVSGELSGGVPYDLPAQMKRWIQ
jgi:GWxTD domain-containing protein